MLSEKNGKACYEGFLVLPLPPSSCLGCGCDTCMFGSHSVNMRMTRQHSDVDNRGGCVWAGVRGVWETSVPST